MCSNTAIWLCVGACVRACCLLAQLLLILQGRVDSCSLYLPRGRDGTSDFHHLDLMAVAEVLIK